MKYKFLLPVLIIFALAIGFSAQATIVCPTASPLGEACPSEPSQQYYCGGSCRNMAAQYCPTNELTPVSPCNGLDSCGICNSCISNYSLCGSYPSKNCQQTINTSTCSSLCTGGCVSNCSAYNQCNAPNCTCSACASGYELIGGACVGTALKLGPDSVSGTAVIQSPASSILYIVPGGNVGIGTADPETYKLKVQGDTNITGTLTAGVLSGSYTGTISSGNVSSGSFGSGTGGGNYTFPSEVYMVGGWMRFNYTNVGLYWDSSSTGYGQHIYPENTSYMYLRSGQGSASGGWHLIDVNATSKGYVYWDSTGFGLLNNAGSWMLYSTAGSNTVNFPGNLIASTLEGKYKGQSNSATIGSVGWYRIASNSGNRANAEFTLRDYISGGGHSTLTFRAGISYDFEPGMSFTLLNHSYYSTPTFTKVRVWESDYTYDPMYVEVYVARTGDMDYSIYDNLQSAAWAPVVWTAGGTPTGTGTYVAREFEVNNLFTIGDYDDRFTIARGGNVGIGTTSPLSTLHVRAGSSGATPYSSGGFVFENSAAIYSSFLTPNNAEAGFLWGDPQDNDVAWILYSHANNTMYFQVNAGNAMVINANGNVGIGTTSPGAKLEVVGDVISKGTSWTIRTTPDKTWRSVTYGNGLFVAVSSDTTGNNNVMTSPDGINWTVRTTPADNYWTSVTYGNGLFVAVAVAGGSNQVMTSPDGITWTVRTTPAEAANNDWVSVTYGNGLFVAVDQLGNGNNIMTSPDGITWTIRMNVANTYGSSVTYGNGLFVALTLGTGRPVLTSPDGITWTSRTPPVSNAWTSVTYGNGLFVAVAGSGTGNRVMTSPDGITWTVRTSAADNQWMSVTYGNGLFVAVAGSGTGNRVMTSPDGINWTIRTSAADNGWSSVTYANGLFVAVAGSGTGNRVMTSGKSELNFIPPASGGLWAGNTGGNIWNANSGNVGIGTTEPPSYYGKFVVWGDGTHTGAYVYNSGNAAGVIGESDSDDGVRGISNSGTGVYGGSMSGYDFYAANSAGKSYFAGKVGIGTKTPAGKLDVYGDIRGVNEYSFSGCSDSVNNWDGNCTVNPTCNSASDDSWYVQSNSGGWAQGILSKRRFTRTPGLTLEYEAYLDQTPYGGNVHYMVGFAGGSSTSYSYSQTPANLMYHDNAALSVYDNGSSQGTDYSFDTRGAWWKFKIVLKGAGANYYVFRNGIWNQVKSTANNSDKYLRILVSAYNNRIYFRNMRVYQENQQHNFDSIIVSGTLTAGTISGGYSGTISAGNVSSGSFGSGTGGGNYSFPAKVGIGTTSPQAPLNVYKTPTSGFVESFRVGGTDNYRSLDMGTWGAYDAYISTYGNDLHLLSGRGVASENHNIKFYTSFAGTGGEAENNQRMIIRYDGNVGIGTTSPGAKLDVNGTLSLTGTLYGKGSGSDAKMFSNLAIYSSNGATGAIVIQTAVPQDDHTMTTTKVTVHGQYSDGTKNNCELILSGYWSSEANGGFSGRGMINLCGDKMRVRYMRQISTGYVAIVLGETNTTWSYPKVAVTEWLAGYTISDSYADGWSISVTSDLSGYTNSDDVPDTTVATDSTKVAKAGDTISGLLTWGTSNPNPGIRIRHIDGKASSTDTGDTLYLNYSNTGKGVNIGDSGTDHPLNVYGQGYFAGNVGIGTTSPASLLQLGAGSFSATNSSYKEFHAGAFGVLFRDNYDSYITANTQYSASGWVNKYSGYKPGLISMTDGNFYFYTGTGTTAGSNSNISEKMTILNSGNVGIGTTSPGYGLDLQVASGLRIAQSGTSYNGNLVFGNAGGSWASGIRTYDNGDAEMRIWHMNQRGQIILSANYNGNQSTAYPTDGIFIAGTPGTGFNQVGIGYNAASIRAGTGKLLVNGNVGIGTTSPGFKLDVEGASTDTNGKFGVNKPVYLINNSPYIGFNTYYSGGWKFGKGSSSSYAGAIGVGPTDGVMRFYTSNAGNADAATTLSEKLTILQNGYVGIGTTSPSNKLHVSGAIGATDWIGAGCESSCESSGGYAILYPSGYLSLNGANIYGAGGNVGIGTTSPSAKLQVKSGMEIAIYASTGFGAGNQYGVYATGEDYAVYASGFYGGIYAEETSGLNDAVRASGNIGVRATGVTYDFYGTGPKSYFSGQVGIGTTNPGSYKLYVNGSFYANTIAKGSGSFLIDHPLNPENEVLRHSFVESPDMKNIYDGIVILDKNGEAQVELPSYFEALNKDFRYQLTAIGKPAILYIKKEIKDNKFVIAGGIKGSKVSWQVTGTRKDAFALKNPIIVEEKKGTNNTPEKGEYLCPECFSEKESIKE